MRTARMLLAIFGCLSVAGAQTLWETSQPVAAPGSGFHPEDVVRQVRPARPGPSAVGREPPVLDNGEFLIDTSVTFMSAPNGQHLSAVAFDGENFLVVWEDFRGGLDIYGARVTPQGEVLEPAGFVISHSANSQYWPAVGFDGENFLVVWEDLRGGIDSDIYGARVTPEGEVLDSAGFVISQAADDQGAPAVGFDGENFLAVWEDSRSDRLGDIYGARIGPQGTVLDTAGIVVADENYGQGSPVVCAGGPNFLVLWDDIRNRTDNDIYAARVTPGGVVLDTLGTGILVAAGGQDSPALAFDGANFLAVWDDWRGSSSDIFGTRVTPEGAALDSSGFDITLGADDQSSPALAFDGTNFLVVWEDHRGDSCFDIDGARVTPQGTVLDPAGFVISREVHDPAYSAAPAVGFDGANYLVVWGDTPLDGYWHIYGARVSPQGEVLDTAAIAISEAAGHQRLPAVGFDGANFLVAWDDSRSGNYNIYGARVSPQGAVLDTSGLVICQAARYQSSAAVGFDGANFLVTWYDNRSGSDVDIYGARVTPEGIVLDAAGIAISRAAYFQEFPALDFDGENFLVVWQDYGSEGYSDVYGARVTPEGKVLDTAGIAIAKAEGRQELPAVGFDGEKYVVLWGDSRSGIDVDIYGARVAPDGAVFDIGPVILQPGDQKNPVLCRDGNGSVFPVYQGWVGTVNGRHYNTCRIWGGARMGLAIGEVTGSEARQMISAATIVRGVLVVNGLGGNGDSPSEREDARYSPHFPVMARATLLDISGRKVMDLKPGANDVRALAPGVYFIREGLGIRGEGRGKTQRVVVTR